MENFDESLSEMNNEELPASAEEVIYPPKYQKQDQTANIWLKSFFSLALYLVLGYYIFHSFKILMMITAIVFADSLAIIGIIVAFIANG